VTDANLALGYLRDGAELGGAVTLDRQRAENALRALGEQLGLDPVETALGVVRVANAEMTRALRVISVERGLDPREFALVAFGGAGGMHAAALAEELGIPRVLLPRAGGVLSALGLAMSDLRRDRVTPLLRPLDAGASAAIDAAAQGLEEDARAELPGATLRRSADLRYRGQSFELTVDASEAGDLAERFHEAHERRYGYRMDGEPVEVVCVRVVALVPAEASRPSAESAAFEASPAEIRSANFGGEWIDATVLAGESLARGARVEGPAVVELAEATCVVPPEWTGTVDDTGALVLERRA
jgi:N-methylhydantoinase A